MSLTKLPFRVAGATALVVSLGFYLANPPAQKEPATPKPLVPPADQQTHGASLTPISSARVAKTRGTGSDAEVAPLSLLSSQAANKLGIRPEDLIDACGRADEMAANMDRRKAAAADPGYYNRSLNTTELSRRLALRLGLDSDAAKRVEGIFSQYRENQTAKLMEAECNRLERESQLLDADRESYVDYLAIQAMISRGNTLSKEQESFYNAFRGLVEPEIASTGPSDAGQWYQNPDLLNAMGQQLSAEQRSGLATYVEEQMRRDAEAKTMQAYMRSGTIAEKLGLSEADRATLYEYFQDHPNASRAELAELVTPELAALLPEGM